jgi:DNA-binding HxlR family transcriptional regulator
MTDTVRNILLALVRVHIRHHAVSERIFGAGVAQVLACHGYQISPGTLYPLLHRLEQDGLLTSASGVVAGKARKRYVATDKGRQGLAALQPI